MKIFTLPVLLLLLSATTVTAQFARSYTSCYEDPGMASLNVSGTATDKNGNTYIIGNKTNQGDEYYQTHMFLRKVSPTGVQEWIRYFNAAQDSMDNAKSIALDTAGNIYVTGTRIDTFCNICTYRSQISDVVTMKYNPAGTRIWLNRYAPGDYILGSPSDIQVLPNGYSLVTANQSAYNPATFVWENTGLIIAIAANGRTIWTKKLDKIIANAASVDKKGNILVAGAYDPLNLLQTAVPYIAKISKAGNTLWSYTKNEFNKYGQFYSVYTDAKNNVYANGQTDTLAFFNNKRILTVKLNGNGAESWSRKEASNTYTMPGFYGNFTIDAAGNSYVAGSQTNVYFKDWIVSKYNTAGNLQWTKVFNGTRNGEDLAIDITTDAAGLVYVAGSSFNNSPNVPAMTLTIYDASGNLYYQNFYQNQSYGIAMGVGLDGLGNVYMSGNNNCTVKYRPVTARVSAAAASDITSSALKLTVYPNPATDKLSVQLTTTASRVQYRIINVHGNEVAKNTVPNNKILSIPVKQLAAGMYILQVIDGKKIYNQQFIKQ